MMATTPSPVGVPVSPWKQHPLAWAALALSLGFFAYFAWRIERAARYAQPKEIPMSVEPRLNGEAAWHVNEPFGPFPPDQPFVQASRWEGDRYLLAFTRIVGKEAERIELSVHLGHSAIIATAKMKWYVDSGIPEFARIDTGSVTVNTDDLPSDASWTIVEYGLKGARGEEPVERRGTVAFRRADLYPVPSTTVK